MTPSQVQLHMSHWPSGDWCHSSHWNGYVVHYRILCSFFWQTKVIMATRVYVLYQNSRLVLISLITLWLGVTTVGCVRVSPQCMIVCPMTDKMLISGQLPLAMPFRQARQISLFYHSRQGISAAPPAHIYHLNSELSPYCVCNIRLISHRAMCMCF